LILTLLANINLGFIIVHLISILLAIIVTHSFTDPKTLIFESGAYIKVFRPISLISKFHSQSQNKLELITSQSICTSISSEFSHLL
jgi:hypothetical protein